jgi:hypothetical protein
LVAAERERIGAITAHSSDLPVLLVGHDIDRVFQLADRSRSERRPGASG